MTMHGGFNFRCFSIESLVFAEGRGIEPSTLHDQYLLEVPLPAFNRISDVRLRVAMEILFSYYVILKLH